MIGKTNNKLSIRRQCDLFSVNRSRLYYVSMLISQVNLSLMNRIDEEFTAHPFTGVDRMVEIIRRQDGLVVNHKRIRWLMRKMGLMAIYPKPRTTQSIIEHAKYPCLIRKLNIDHADQVWCSDITYTHLKAIQPEQRTPYPCVLTRAETRDKSCPLPKPGQHTYPQLL